MLVAPKLSPAEKQQARPGFLKPQTKTEVQVYLPFGEEWYYWWDRVGLKGTATNHKFLIPENE